jgi:CheY-like chemotaxis protein/DNA-binding SARP family transcriptional activator
MAILTIRLFGEFRATDHRGNPLQIGSRKNQALLIWLALHRNTPVPLHDFGALFGIDDVGGLARDLRHALRSLPADLLAGDGDAIRFRPAAVEVDIARFDSLVAGGSVHALRQAADVYSGNLLDGFTSGIGAFDQWLAGERLHYWRAALSVLGKLLAVQIKAGWWENASETAGRLLALDPTQEVVHRTLMRLRMEQGRPDAALRRYQECCDILRREFQRNPSAETERVHEEIIAALQKTPAPRDLLLKPFDRSVLILVVEDDAVSAALIDGFLGEAGYEAICVADGADALMELGRREFDLLVLDINIPTLDGLRLFEIMIQKGIDTPAIFVTGSASPETEARSLELGAADFLRKPIRKEALLPRIRTILQRRERARENS